MSKVALITGGRSGIGLACAQKLSQSGYEVVTAQRNPAETFHSIGADFSDPDTPKRVIQQVIDKFIVELQAQLDEKGVSLELTKDAKQWLADNGYDKTMGARPMSRLIQEHLKKPLASELLFGELSHGGVAKVGVRKKKIVINYVNKKELANASAD